jgi:death-on-curing protein
VAERAAFAIKALSNRRSSSHSKSSPDQELYPSLAEKAAALGFFLIQNHPFVDGNKRAGHAALETVLILNGYELSSPVDEQERIILAVASDELDRETFTAWVQTKLVPAG